MTVEARIHLLLIHSSASQLQKKCNEVQQILSIGNYPIEYCII